MNRPLPALAALLCSPLALAGLTQEEDWTPQAPEFRRYARNLANSDNPTFGERALRKYERILANSEQPPNRRLAMLPDLARLLLKRGEVERAIEHLEEVLAAQDKRTAPEDDVTADLALAYLRLAENRNCIERRNASCCIFPLAGEGLHAVREPAERARELYLAAASRAPEDLELRWLLNLCCMALGEYPDGVPEEHRIPPAAFASEEEFPRFRDVARELGVDAFNMCGGVVVEDFDGNGHMDVLTSTYDPTGPLTFYAATGDGRFEDRSAASRSRDQLGGLNLVAGDYDADGDMDAFVLRGAWLGTDGVVRNSLLRNDGGVFSDVTRAAGMDGVERPTQTAAWGDYDGDGDLDLFVGNESLDAVRPELAMPDELWMNQGDGTFLDQAQERGVTRTAFTKGVAAGDYDNDGDLDLYLSNIGPNQLLRNDGEGRFEDATETAGVAEPTQRSFATWFFDYDNDGWLDLFVGAYEAKLSDLAAEALGLEEHSVKPRLYRNDGDGTFTDVAAAMGLARPFKPMGAGFGDIDHDGFLDVYLTTGEPQLQSLVPNVMLRNRGGERFVDVTTAGGFGHLQKGHGVAFADLDQDGDQDVYHQLGGFFPVDRYSNVLFENPGNGNRFLYVDLVGTRSNRRGVGARIRVVVEAAGAEQTFHRAVGCVSSFGGSPLRQEIGLGAAERVKLLEVCWPDGGAVQTFADVALDSLVTVHEDRTEPVVRALVPAPFVLVKEAK